MAQLKAEPRAEQAGAELETADSGAATGAHGQAAARWQSWDLSRDDASPPPDLVDPHLQDPGLAQSAAWAAALEDDEQPAAGGYGDDAADELGRDAAAVEPAPMAQPSPSLASGAGPAPATSTGALEGPAVQLSAAGGGAADADPVATATEATRGADRALPHAGAVQAAFGHHDVSHVRAAVGGPAAAAGEQLGARAFAIGDRVGFAESPSLHTAAHEAAHVVQQRQGVQLEGGMGRVGDPYERHADAVADAVVAGRSAEALLDRAPGSGGGQGVQRKASPKPKTANAKPKTRKGGARLEVDSTRAGGKAAALERFILIQRLGEFSGLVMSTGFPRSFFGGLRSALNGLSRRPADKKAVFGGCEVMRRALTHFASPHVRPFGQKVDHALRRRRAEILMTRLLPEIKRFETAAENPVATLKPSFDRMTGALQDYLGGVKGRAKSFDGLKKSLAKTTRGSRFTSYCIGTYVVTPDAAGDASRIKAKDPSVSAGLKGIVGQTLPFNLLYAEDATTATLSLVGHAGGRGTVEVARLTMKAPQKTGKAARRQRFQTLLASWSKTQGQLPQGQLDVPFQGAQFKRTFKVTAWWAQLQQWLDKHPEASFAVLAASIAGMFLGGASLALLSRAGAFMMTGGLVAGTALSGINLYAKYKKGMLWTDIRSTTIDLFGLVAGVAGLGATSLQAAEGFSMWWFARQASNLKKVDPRVVKAMEWAAPLSSRIQAGANYVAIGLGPTTFMLATPDMIASVNKSLKEGKKGMALAHVLAGLFGAYATVVSVKGALQAEGFDAAIARTVTSRPDLMKVMPAGLQKSLVALAGKTGKPRLQALANQQDAIANLKAYADPKVGRVLDSLNGTLKGLGRVAGKHRGTKADTVHADPLTALAPPTVKGSKVVYEQLGTKTTPIERRSGNVRTPGKKAERGSESVHTYKVTVDGQDFGQITVKTRYEKPPTAEYERTMKVPGVTDKASCSVSVTKQSGFDVQTFLETAATSGRYGLSLDKIKTLYQSSALKNLQAMQKSGMASLNSTIRGNPLTTAPTPSGQTPVKPGEPVTPEVVDPTLSDRVSSHASDRVLLISSVFAHLDDARVESISPALPFMGNPMMRPREAFALPGGPIAPSLLADALKATFESHPIPKAAGGKHTPGQDYDKAVDNPKTLAKLKGSLKASYGFQHFGELVWPTFGKKPDAKAQKALAKALAAFEPSTLYKRFQQEIGLGITLTAGWRFGGSAWPGRFPRRIGL